MFTIGLCLAASLALIVDHGLAYQLRQGRQIFDLSQKTKLELQTPRPLTLADRSAAERAWRYMRNNTQPETGWVDSVAGFPSSTLWDQGSYLLALVAAERLKIIDKDEFDTRISQLLESFERIALFDGKLPNKVYNTKTLEMVDYANQPTPDGIGWSALDVARMLLAFRILEKRNPEYGHRIRTLLSRWDIQAMGLEGELWGALREGGKTVLKQEGRLGYEQYGARAAAMWGMDVLQAVSARRALKWVDVNNIEVPADIRRSDVFRAITPILSEPYILQAVEMGLDSENKIMAERVYHAQEARHGQTGFLTAVSEDHIDQAPHFLYSTVFSNAEPWAVVTESGAFYPQLRTISVKASFAWNALYNTEYTKLLRKRIAGIGEVEKGWPAGIYETDGSLNDIYTLNTNAVVIEAIHYIENGPLWSVR
jgi:hypothetical protein